MKPQSPYFRVDHPKVARNLISLLTLINIILIAGCTSLTTPDNGLEILSDTDFEEHGIPGRGTLQDPYVIANRTFTGVSYGIRIEGTTKHFRILNCQIEKYYEGIFIRDIEAGTGIIANNSIGKAYPNSHYLDPGLRAGIEISNSANMTVQNNHIISSTHQGINLNYVKDCYISNNVLSGQFTSLGVFNTENCIIDNNTLEPSQEVFYSSESRNLTISNNECKGGSRFYELENSTIVNNSFFDAYTTADLVNGGYGIYTRSIFSYYINNWFENNELYAIYLTSTMEYISKYNWIYHNGFMYNAGNGTQAADDGRDNMWYNSDLAEGNYWSDWSGTDTYSIDGTAHAVDAYPLSVFNGTSS